MTPSSQRHPLLSLLLWTALFLTSPGDSLAARPKVMIAQSERGVLQLEADGASVPEVLGELSRVTGIAIGYAGEPGAPIRVQCRRETPLEILRCLLGEDADLMVRYARPGQVDSITILASTFVAPPPVSLETRHGRQILALIHSRDPNERARGVADLGGLHSLGKAERRELYQQALADENGEVRAEAVSGLALLDGKRSFALLGNAFRDRDASVRLAALDGMEVNDESLPYLEQALSDPDETVRELAQLRLGLD